MNKLPSPFWAIILAMQGVVIVICVLFVPTPLVIATAVLTIASNLVSGALGAFAGHASATSDTKVTGSNPVVNQIPPTKE
jgi:hypothetical protein